LPSARSSRAASTICRSLPARVRGVPAVSRTSCMVMVEPPNSPPRTLSHSARAIADQSTPPCSKKSLSSEASAAFTRCGEIRASGTQRSRRPALVASCRSKNPLSSVTSSEVAAVLSRSASGKSAARTEIQNAAQHSASASAPAASRRRGQRQRLPSAARRNAPSVAASRAPRITWP
jgi:hypothetical protein